MNLLVIYVCGLVTLPPRPLTPDPHLHIHDMWRECTRWVVGWTLHKPLSHSGWSALYFPVCLASPLSVPLSCPSLPCSRSRAHWIPTVTMCSSPSSLWHTCLRGWWRYSTPYLTCIRACVLCVSSAGTLHAERPWHSHILSPPSSHVWKGYTGMCLSSEVRHNEITCGVMGSLLPDLSFQYLNKQRHHCSAVYSE